jgi:hypothetical protein
LLSELFSVAEFCSDGCGMNRSVTHNSQSFLAFYLDQRQGRESWLTPEAVVNTQCGLSKPAALPVNETAASKQS